MPIRDRPPPTPTLHFAHDFFVIYFVVCLLLVILLRFCFYFLVILCCCGNNWDNYSKPARPTTISRSRTSLSLSPRTL